MKSLNIKIRISSLYDKYLDCVIKAPPVILFFVGCFYSFYIFGNLEKDTTKISNIAFGIVAVLTGLSLRMASTLSKSDEKDRFMYSGERFFHSTLLLLSASIIKYMILTINDVELLKEYYILKKTLTFPLDVLVPLLFFFAVHSAHTGMKITNDLLWRRMGRVKDWDNLYK